jgi:phosphopantothenoylcysteine decarboxylase/phosphopantothenate--cysteine ligase
MWKHPATQSNINKLTGFGNVMINPAFGELASGLVGEGRMAEPEEIVTFLHSRLSLKPILKGKKVLVTAGPTFEAIDPVRFIGNHSSGKMGFALAEQLAQLGADVSLICGPTALKIKHTSIKRINVVSADEMFNAVKSAFPTTDITIMSAAVADYTPKEVAHNKIKKNEEAFTIELVKTKDILVELGRIKKEHQILVGFALETNNEEENALNKLKKKNLDFIVLNSLNDKGAGFQSDTNKITIIDKHLSKEVFSLKSKEEVAIDICNKIIAITQ